MRIGPIGPIPGQLPQHNVQQQQVRCPDCNGIIVLNFRTSSPNKVRVPFHKHQGKPCTGCGQQVVTVGSFY